MVTPRRFVLSDAIILITATAVGLAVFRPYHARDPGVLAASVPFRTTFHGVGQRPLELPGAGISVRNGVDAGDPRPAASPPSPGWRRLVRQPGFIAGFMAALVLALRLCGFATMQWRVGSDPGLAVWSPRVDTTNGIHRRGQSRLSLIRHGSLPGHDGDDRHCNRVELAAHARERPLAARANLDRPCGPSARMVLDRHSSPDGLVGFPRAILIDPATDGTRLPARRIEPLAASAKAVLRHAMLCRAVASAPGEKSNTSTDTHPL